MPHPRLWALATAGVMTLLHPHAHVAAFQAPAHAPHRPSWRPVRARCGRGSPLCMQQPKAGQAIGAEVLRTAAAIEEGIQHLGECTPDAFRRDYRVGLLGLSALSGAGYAAIQAMPGVSDAATNLAIRSATSALVLAPWLRNCHSKVIVTGLETGVWLWLGYMAQATCLQTARAGTSVFLASLTIAICPIVERITGKRLDDKAKSAIGLALLGAAALEFGGSEVRAREQRVPQDSCVRGARAHYVILSRARPPASSLFDCLQAPRPQDCVGLLQPLFFAVHLARTETALAKYPRQGIRIAAVQTAVCATASLGWMAYSHHSVGPAFTDFPAALDLVRHLQINPEQAEQAQTLLAIKSATSVVPEAHGGLPAVSSQVLQTVDALMQPVHDARPSLQAATGIAPTALDSKLALHNGVAELLMREKAWAQAPKFAALAFLGVLSSAAVLAVGSVAQGSLTASESAVVMCTETLWSAGVGSLLVGTDIGLNIRVGGLLAFVGSISRVWSVRELWQDWQDGDEDTPRSTVNNGDLPGR